MTSRKTAGATRRVAPWLCLFALLGGGGLAQDAPKEKKEEPPAGKALAIINVRILPVAGKEIPKGTILVRGGKIAEIGADVEVPEDAEVIDAEGRTAIPGLVNPYSRLGGTIRSGGTKVLPHYLAYDEFNPAVETFSRIARSGYTSFAVYPMNGTVSGRAMLVKPVGITKETMVAEKAVYLRMDMELGSSVKKLLRKEFDAVRKVIEAEKKAEAERKKEEAAKKAAAKKEGEKKEGEKTEEKKDGEKKQDDGKKPPPAQAKPPGAKPPMKKPDEKTQALLDYFSGKFPAIVEIDSPAELLHFWQVLKEVEDLAPKYSIRTGSQIYLAADRVGERELCVVLPPSLTYLAYTRYRVNPAAELAEAGARVAFLPQYESVGEHQSMLYRATMMVKYGLDRDHALRALTLHPAQAAGIDKRVGTREKGKDADIVLLSGDPFDVMTRTEMVLINGETAYERE